jgi:hypothetical protein
MKLCRLAVGLGLALIVTMSESQAAPVRTEQLWHQGKDSIAVVPCEPGRSDDPDHCLALQISNGTNRSIIGDGYAWARLIWARKPGQNGPDVVAIGDKGGSSGGAELIAVSLSPRPAIWKRDVAPSDLVSVVPGHKTLCLGLPFGIGRFNGASNAETTYVSIPVCWSAGRFVLDSKALAAQSFPDGDLRFREVAIFYELNRWSSDLFPATNLYPNNKGLATPVTVRALADLMLSGHADVAHQILHRNWPKTREHLDVAMGGEKEFWTALCRLITQNPNWGYFHLDQMPHADVISHAAAQD